MTHVLRATALLCGLLLTACGGEPAGTAYSEQQSRALQPADSDLAEIYNRSCKSCHTIAATGAPLTGDTAAWAAVMEQGMDTVLEHVFSGFKGSFH